MPASYLTLSSSKISLSLVQGKVFSASRASSRATSPLYLSAAALCSWDSWVRSLTFFSREERPFPGPPEPQSRGPCIFAEARQRPRTPSRVPPRPPHAQPSRRRRPPKRPAPLGGMSISPRKRLGAPASSGIKHQPKGLAQKRKHPTNKATETIPR